MTLTQKTLEDFGSDKKADGLHGRTMETIRSHVRRVREESEDVHPQCRESEEMVGEAQHSVDTCDTVLRKLDEMQGKD